MPAFDWLCNPCAKSADCQKGALSDAACVNYGVGGNFCGTVCSDNKGCPTGYKCESGKSVEGKTLKQCVREGATKDGLGTCSCSDYAKSNKLTTSCVIEHKNDKGEVIGSCDGTRTCAAAGLTKCVGTDPEAEKCDGVDNDCDGKVDEGTCDDNNACTKDACDPKGDGGKGACIHNKLQGPCDADGSACTPDDTCVNGVCTPGKAKNCDDGNACTKDACLPATGCTQTNDDGTGCNADDNPCTVGDVCKAGACSAGKPKACATSDACLAAKCDPLSGKCKFKPAPEGSTCDDGSKCTTGDGCKKGDCQGTLVDCNDNNPCTTDSCNATKGCVKVQNKLPCDDKNACTTGEVCKAGACATGAAIKCDDGNACTADSCDPTSGKCKTKNLTSLCDDGNKCTVKDTCGDGFCTGKAAVCDDGNACTSDGCNTKTGCTNKANNLPCDDNNKCTDKDGCKGGSCVGLAKQVTTDCNDNNVCTTDSCDPKAGCVHKANLAPCDDGNPCTKGDVCKSTKCNAGVNVCQCVQDADCKMSEDGNLCNGTLYCDKSKAPYSCLINPKTIVTCTKANDTACLVNQCAMKTGTCGMTIINEGKPCNADGSVCTNNDACKAGKCAAGPAVDCNDKNPCTSDSCDPKAGCKYAANTAPCNADDNKCTIADQCAAKVCKAGKPKVCNDGNICTADSCAPKTGACGYDKTKLTGKACNDGNACTTNDGCKAGVCKGVGKNCDDSDPCTKDSCSLSKGCTYSPAAGSCDDGNACTVGDKCGKDAKDKHGCLPGKKRSCDDGNVCTLDSCDPKKGCVAKPDTGKQHDCYDGPKGSDGKGTCKKGKATCTSKGTLSGCIGQVVPNKTEKCDGKDDTCNGVVDEGCNPVGIKFALGGVRIQRGQSGSAKYGLKAFGASKAAVGGKTGSGARWVRWSVLAWLKAVAK